jgi:hypothetical protein
LVSFIFLKKKAVGFGAHGLSGNQLFYEFSDDLKNDGQAALRSRRNRARPRSRVRSVLAMIAVAVKLNINSIL